MDPTKYWPLHSRVPRPFLLHEVIDFAAEKLEKKIFFFLIDKSQYGRTLTAESQEPELCKQNATPTRKKRVKEQ